MKRGFLFLKYILLGVLVLVFLVFWGQKRNDKADFVNVMVVLVGGDELDRTEEFAPYWLVDAINVGDVDKTVSDKENARVVDIETYEEGFRKIALVTLKLRVTLDREMSVTKYKGKDLYTGSIIELKFPTARSYARVVKVSYEGNDLKTRVIEIKVRLVGTEDGLVRECKTGDKVIDSKNGTTLVEVLGVTSKSIDSNSTMAKAVDPNSRLMDVDLKLLVRSIDGTDYYALYQPVKVGNKLYIPMDNYNLYDAEVLTIEDGNI